jgi:tRNA(Ile)-lysidine synthase TilS/MesJ
MTNKGVERFLCCTCVLPSTFPGITFNADGVCNHCQRYKGKDATLARQKKYEDKFLKLIESQKQKRDYDVIVAYSGGKDSTYTIDVFVNRYNLKVLTVTFDNTFISPTALKNITRVCGNLGVDNILVKPNPTMLRKIFKTAASRELYSAKTLERASTICTSCISFVKGITLRTALEKKIPFVGYGWSPGQAPVQASVMKTNPAFMKESQQTTLGPLREIAGDSLLPFFVTDEQFTQKELFPWNIHPLAFLEYDEDKIVERIKQFGWERPRDTDPNSSNCTLNAFANQVHRIRYDFHPYVWEIANMVRTGVLTREEGIEKIEPSEDRGMVDYSQKELGMS